MRNHRLYEIIFDEMLQSEENNKEDRFTHGDENHEQKAWARDLLHYSGADHSVP